jgi:hypothetical protein
MSAAQSDYMEKHGGLTPEQLQYQMTQGKIDSAKKLAFTGGRGDPALEQQYSKLMSGYANL